MSASGKGTMSEKNINLHTVEYFVTFLSSNNVTWLQCVTGGKKLKYFRIIMTSLKF